MIHTMKQIALHETTKQISSTLRTIQMMKGKMKKATEP
jgi:hypothetical protein